MKRSLFATLLGAFCLAPALPAEPSERFYVAPQGSDHWSGRLARANAAHSDGPFATLVRAQQALRATIRHGLRAPVDVEMETGTYYLAQPLTFTPEDSGTDAAPITYRTAPGAVVTISGGVPVTGWRRQTANVWAAPVLPGTAFRLLRVGTRWATRARWPNADPAHPNTGGWAFAQSAGKGFLGVAPGALPHWTDMTGAELHTVPSAQYYSAIVPINSADPDTGQVTLDPKYDPGLERGNRFFIENVREALDATGEWFLDTARHQVLYLSPDGGFTRAPVVAPRMDHLVRLEGGPKNGQYVHDLRFVGLRFRDADYTLTDNYYVPSDAAIQMSGARNCTVEGCVFAWLGGYALRLENDSQHIQFLGNSVHDVGQGAVVMLGDNTNQPHDNEVAGNTMTRLGLVYKHVAGVYVTTGSGNHIHHNTISDVPRYGISLKSYDAHNGSHRNVVEYNDIRRTNQETHDSGAIETLGRDRVDSGNVIRYNLLLDSGGRATDADGRFHSPDFTWGIYLDDFSSGTTVSGNIVARTVLGGFDIHGGRNNTIENNVFVDATQHQTFYQTIDAAFMRGNVVRHNIVTYADPKADLVLAYAPPGQSYFTTWDDNLYWLTGADLNSLTAKITPLGTFAQWQAAGLDTHSRVADPLFFSRAHDDYRLRPGSPAYGLGFRRIPLEQIGAGGWRR